MGKQMIMSWLGDQLLTRMARVLATDERAAILGDLQEENTDLLPSIVAVAGYLLRRECAAWDRVDPWLVLLIVTMPSAILLGSVSLNVADGSAISVWCFANNWDVYLLHQAGFWTGLRHALINVSWSLSALVFWSWCCGVAIGAASRKTVKSSAVLICLFFAVLVTGWRPPTGDLQALHLARDFPNNAAAFRNYFYRDVFSPLVQLIFVLVPLLRGLKDAQLKLSRSAWKGATFWVLVSVSLASLLAESSVWWQVRTWNTSPPITPHLPSVVPFALCGGLAWLIVRHSYVRSSMQAYTGE